MCYNIRVVGVWRRLVARYLGVVEAVGSSPVTPTKTHTYELIIFRYVFAIVVKMP